MAIKTKRTQLREAIAKAFDVQDTDSRVLMAVDLITTAFPVLTDRGDVKRDMLIGWGMMGAEETQRMEEIKLILQTFERELRRKDDLAGDADWQDFARGFVRREMKEGHDYHDWLNWYTKDAERLSWAWKETPKTIKARWLLAFDERKSTVAYIQPDPKEGKYVPNPYKKPAILSAKD